MKKTMLLFSMASLFATTALLSSQALIPMSANFTWETAKNGLPWFGLTTGTATALVCGHQLWKAHKDKDKLKAIKDNINHSSVAPAQERAQAIKKNLNFSWMVASRAIEKEMEADASEIVKEDNVESSLKLSDANAITADSIIKDPVAIQTSEKDSNQKAFKASSKYRADRFVAHTQRIEQHIKFNKNRKKYWTTVTLTTLGTTLAGYSLYALINKKIS